MHHVDGTSYTPAYPPTFNQILTASHSPHISHQALARLASTRHPPPPSASNPRNAPLTRHTVQRYSSVTFKTKACAAACTANHATRPFAFAAIAALPPHHPARLRLPHFTSGGCSSRCSRRPQQGGHGELLPRHTQSPHRCTRLPPSNDFGALIAGSHQRHLQVANTVALMEAHLDGLRSIKGRYDRLETMPCTRRLLKIAF